MKMRKSFKKIQDAAEARNEGKTYDNFSLNVKHASHTVIHKALRSVERPEAARKEIKHLGKKENEIA